jgi:hypothetical protein
MIKENHEQEIPTQTGGGEMKYKIIIGEAGAEIGHTEACRARSDAGAIRAARRRVAEYEGDGWWIVRGDGIEIARGGRQSL